MKIKNIVVGPLESNCYVVYDEGCLKALVIDPGDDAKEIVRFLKGKGLEVESIVCTHAHFDHIGALADLKAETGAPVVLHKADVDLYRNARRMALFWGFDITEPPEPERIVNEGDEVSVGPVKFKVFETPGHSPGSICLYGSGMVFSGDTVFAGSVGRTDLPGGDYQALKKSFARIMSLPAETTILPGHGGPSTVAAEKESNFFIHEL